MIEIKDKKQCCGCEACVNACPKQCIKMEYDEEGFRYPVVNRELCISCGICNEKCHLQKEIQIEERSIPTYYAAYYKDRSVVRDSSSGGIFWAMVESIMALGNGVVYGAACESGIKVTHERATTIEECKKFRKSKYLQSNMDDTYIQVKEDLKNGNTVLFSGTPCQIAALYGFLGKSYDTLYTVEVICHGVPSEFIYEKYIDYLGRREKAAVAKICWRDKEFGWNPSHVSYTFDNGKRIIYPSEEDSYMYGFTRTYFLRPSCYECKYAKLPRTSDVSIADFWHYSGKLSADNENAGISAVIVSSVQGQKLWNMICDKLNFHTVEEEYLKKRSRHVWKHPAENPKREKVFQNLDKKSYQKIDLQIRGTILYRWMKKVYKRLMKKRRR